MKLIDMENGGVRQDVGGMGKRGGEMLVDLFMAMARSQVMEDLTVGFPDIQNGGSWGASIEQEKPMLDFGRVCSSGRANYCTATIVVVFMIPKGHPFMPQRPCWLSLSFDVSILIFIPPSRSTSPALLYLWSLLSFHVSTLKDNTRAPPHSINPPTPIAVIIVIVVLSVAVLVVIYMLRGASCPKMMADMVYTVAIGIDVDVGGAGSVRVWVRVEFGPWQHMGDSTVLLEHGGGDYCHLRSSMVLHHSRAYAAVVGSRLDAIRGSWGHRMR
ncbi:hypothetical protein EDD85DRAFT_792982 [Armillaria nabsnona]|nr:hypothetical protein EDD85DRAFT_792982 [Armillaria nabsnona]